MRFLIQRVSEASVSVDGRVIGQIGKGFVVFVGIRDGDALPYRNSISSESGGNDGHPKGGISTEIADRMVKKLVGLRIFEDGNGKTNLDLKSVGGQLLIISQFTLYADCRKGNRPSFTRAGEPRMANALYRYIVEKCRREIEVVEEGSFGADMKVALVNDGPFTVMLDSDGIC